MALSEKIQNYLGEDFTSAMKTAGEVASIASGAAGYIAVGQSMLTALGVFEEPVNPFTILQQQIQVLQQKLDELLLELEKTQAEIAQVGSGMIRSDISNDASDVKSAAYNAYAFVKFPSEANKNAFLESQTPAQTKTNHFVDNPKYWERFFLAQDVYSDVWSGTLTPPLNDSEGFWVWDYSMALPAHIGALANWVIVILASDQGYRMAHLFDGTEIIGHIGKLNETLAKILQSYTPIRPPSYDEMKYLIMASDDANFYVLGIQGGGKYYLSPEERDAVLAFIPGGKWRLAGYPCGIIEKYTGWTDIEAYPLAEIIEAAPFLKLSASFWVAGEGQPPGGGLVEIADPVAYQAFYQRFCLRHTLKTWRHARQLSQKIGLPELQKTIVELCKMRNIAPPQMPQEWFKYVGVSTIREIWGILPEIVPDFNASQAVSLRNIAISLQMEGPISLRKTFALGD